MKENIPSLNNTAEQYYAFFQSEKNEEKKQQYFETALTEGSLQAFIAYDNYLKNMLAKDFNNQQPLLENAEQCIKYHNTVGWVLLAGDYFHIATYLFEKQFFQEAKNHTQEMEKAFQQAIDNIPESTSSIKLLEKTRQIRKVGYFPSELELPTNKDAINDLRKLLKQQLNFPNELNQTCAMAAR